ncbi:MAG: ComF family protein [Clostridia bacterium]|nr:ComF family protein [Clostridia bacterium]
MKRQKMTKMKQKEPVPTVPSLLNLIYPPKCGICGKLNKSFLCNKCYKILENDANFNIEKKLSYEHIYLFKYEGLIRRLIIEYKFKDKSYLYKTIVNFLLKNKKMFEIIKSYDTIIPVPISKKRKKTRGYNQTYLIAKDIANSVGIKLENRVLFKTKNIIEQSKLNKEDRLENIKGVYEIRNAKRIINKKILLFDDIYTTGSTVNECCKMLKKTNLDKIGVLTVAKD